MLEDILVDSCVERCCLRVYDSEWECIKYISGKRAREHVCGGTVTTYITYTYAIICGKEIEKTNILGVEDSVPQIFVTY